MLKKAEVSCCTGMYALSLFGLRESEGGPTASAGAFCARKEQSSSNRRACDA